MSTDDRKAQLGVEVDSTGAKKGFEEVKQGARDMARDVAQSGRTAAGGLDQIGANGEQAAARTDRATRSLINSIQRTTAAMQAGSQSSADYYRSLANQRGASTAALEPYLRQLEEVTRRQQQMATSAGVSAAQTAAAMRSIPAQFTDIVTQLAGGGNPLLILTQQGGQLKDQFGSVGAAARGMGSYIAGLVNPMTLLAAAGAGLAAAFVVGERQSAALARSIALTGNAAGITEGQFNALAKSVADSTKTTIGSARETVQALVNTGRLSGDALERAATAAQLLGKVSRQTAESIRQQFAAAADGPAKFAAELNKSFNILTAAELEQIRTLEDQGRTQEALARTFDALNTRLRAAAENFGTLERWWDTLKRKGAEGIDFVLRIGRVETPQDTMSKLDAEIDRVRRTLPQPGLPFAGRRTSTIQRDLDALQAQRDAVGEVARLQSRAAALSAEGVRNEQIKADWLGVQEKNRSKQKKLEDELEAVRAKAAERSRIAGSDTERAQIQRELADAEKQIRERNTDKGGASAARAAAKDQRNAELEGIKGLERERVEAAKQAQDEIRVLRATGVLDERQAIEENTRLDVAGLTAKKASLEDQLALMSKRKFSETEVARVAREAAEVDAQIKTRMLKGENDLIIAIHQREEAWAKATQAENASFVEKQQDRAVQLQAEVKAQLEANTAIGKSAVELAGLEAAKLSETAATKERLAAEAEANLQSKELIDAYRAQAQALRDLAAAKQQGAILQTNAETAKKAKEEWQRTSDQIGQALANSLMEGGKSAGEYIKGLFRTMVLQPVIKAIVQPIAGGVASILTGGASAAGGGGGGSSALGYLNNASTAYSLYGAATGGTIANLGALAFGAGQATGWGSLAAFGTGMQGATLGAGLAGPTTVGATGAMGAGATVGSALSSIGSAIPYVAAVVAVLNLLGAFRSKKVVGNGLVGTVGDGSDLDVFNLIRRGGTLFSGPSYSIQTADADPKLVQGIQTAVAGMLAQARAQANVFGAGGNLASFSAPLGSELIHPEVGRMGITLTGLSDEEARKKIETEVTKLAETMAAQALGPAGQALAKAGETATQTLQRLSGSLSAVNTALGTFNDNLLAANLAGADAASQLADLFGGIDQFTQSSQAYYQRFFTDAERAANATKQLGQAFTELGLGALPASKAAYRELVNAQDLTTESGRKTYASLLSLSGIFADLKDAVEQASESVQSEIQRLRGTSGGQSAASLQAQFTIKTAAARAGDAKALSALPELSQALEKARSATATSAADVAFVRASLAASLSETLRALKVPGFADGGMHAGGWRVVGERGPELEWTPASRIYSNPQSQALLSTERLEAKVGELTAKVAELQGQLLAAETQQIFYTKRMSDLLMAVTRGGESIAVREGD